MFSLTPKEESGLGHRDARWPDPGVHRFVVDVLREAFDIDPLKWPDYVIPVAIVSTLDWIQRNGVWVFRNTGLWQTDEPYKFVFEYQQAELSPNDVFVFRDEEERNQFKKRIQEPGLSTVEREEGLAYVREIGFLMWEKDRPRTESAGFVPPDFVIERAMWATLMWVLSKNGRDWLYMLDPIISSTYDFGVGYLYNPTSELLDPKQVIVHRREPHSCRVCGEGLWCVAGAFLGGAWYHVCVNCLQGLWSENPSATDDYRDDRLMKPPCPHLRGIDPAHQGTCRETCRHSGVTPEKVWEAMEAHAKRKVDLQVGQMRTLGQNPQQQAGKDLAQLVDYFKE
jgi:hypothetical protein